jgi:hypothetical protein
VYDWNGAPQDLFGNTIPTSSWPKDSVVVTVTRIALAPEMYGQLYAFVGWFIMEVCLISQ